MERKGIVIEKPAMVEEDQSASAPTLAPVAAKRGIGVKSVLVLSLLLSIISILLAVTA